MVEKEGRAIVNMNQNHTVGNLVRKAVWENGGEAAYDKGHPLGGEANLIIQSDTPLEDIKEAVETAKEWMNELESSF